MIDVEIQFYITIQYYSFHYPFMILSLINGMLGLVSHAPRNVCQRLQPRTVCRRYLAFHLLCLLKRQNTKNKQGNSLKLFNGKYMCYALVYQWKLYKLYASINYHWDKIEYVIMDNSVINGDVFVRKSPSKIGIFDSCV